MASQDDATDSTWGEKIGEVYRSVDGHTVFVVVGAARMSAVKGIGRPPATKRHAAVALAEWLYLARYRKKQQARARVAEVFGYAGEREIRRVTNSENCPIPAYGAVTCY